MAKSKSNHKTTEVKKSGIYSSLITLMHFIAAVQFSYAIYYDYQYVRFPETNTRQGSRFGGKFKYLTFLDAIIQAVYFSISVINDLFGSNDVAPKKLPLIRRLKDFLLAALAFPIALNVGVTFWTLMAIDRELVFPKILDPIFPGWLNHIMHTNIVVFILLEMFISFRSYPKRNNGITCLMIFMASYLIWLHVVRYYSGFWVYPILDVLNLPMRIVFFFVVLVFTLFLYVFGEFLNNMIWTKELKLVSRKSKSN